MVETKEQMNEAIRKQMEEETKMQMYAEMKKQVEAEMKQQMYEEIKKQMENESKEPDAAKHIFVVGALGAGKSTTMSVLFDPTEAATE